MGQNGVSMDRESGSPSPKPNRIQGILEALQAEIDFGEKWKDKMQKMIGISYSNSRQSQH